MINIRLPEELVSMVERVARENGMSISTFTRQSLRRNVDCYQLNEGSLRAAFSERQGELKVRRKMMSFSEHNRWYKEQKERRDERVLRKVEDEQRRAQLRGMRPCKQ